MHPFLVSYASGNENCSAESARLIEVGTISPESNKDSSADQSPADEPALPSSRSVASVLI